MEPKAMIKPNTTDEPPVLLNVAELGRLLNLPPTSIRWAYWSGALPAAAVLPRGTPLFDRAGVKTYLAYRAERGLRIEVGDPAVADLNS